MTPKFHPRLAGAGPFPEAWAVGALHLQTPVSPQMPITPRGLAALGTLLAAPPQRATPAGVCVQVSGTLESYKPGGHSTALSCPQGYHGDAVLALGTWG